MFKNREGILFIDQLTSKILEYSQKSVMVPSSKKYSQKSVELLTTPSPVLVPVRCLRRVEILNFGTFQDFLKVTFLEFSNLGLNVHFFGSN